MAKVNDSDLAAYNRDEDANAPAADGTEATPHNPKTLTDPQSGEPNRLRKTALPLDGPRGPHV